MRLITCNQIRGAIQEYQTQLIDSVKEDIQRLHHKVCLTAFSETHQRLHVAFYSSKRNTDSQKHTTCPKCETYPQYQAP